MSTPSPAPASTPTTIPTPTPTPTPTTSAAQEALRLQLETAGLPAEEVEQFLAMKFGRPVRDVAAAVDAAPPDLKRNKPGTHRTYAPYLRLLVDGLPDLRPCTCIACSSANCPCSADPNELAETCQPSRDSHLFDCADRFTGCGARPVTEVKKADIDDAGWWCQRRGLKRNAARAVQGRVQPTHDGRGSRATLINAARWLLELLIDDGHSGD